MKKSTLLIAVLTPLLVIANLAFTPPGDGGAEVGCQKGPVGQFLDYCFETGIGFQIQALDCDPEITAEFFTCQRGHNLIDFQLCLETAEFIYYDVEFFGTEEFCDGNGGPAY